MPLPVQPLLLFGAKLREDSHGVGRQLVGERRLPPGRDEHLLDLSRQRLLALDGLAGYLAPGLLGDDRSLDVLGTHAGKLGVLGAHPLHLDAERAARCGALRDGEAAHEVVGRVQQHDRLLVGDAPDYPAGNPGVLRILLREEGVGGLPAVPAHHLPAPVVELAHERQVGEPLLLDAPRELLDPRLVHRVDGVGGVVRYLLYGDLLHGIAAARGGVPVEEPRDREPGCCLPSHGAPPPRAPRSLWQGGCLA